MSVRPASQDIARVHGSQQSSLDSLLPAMESPTKAELEQAIKGHVLEKAELIGTYQKS